MNYESLRVTESFWKWISDQTSSNLTWCLSDDGTQSKQLGNCTVLSGRYVWCVMKFMKWMKKNAKSWTWHLANGMSDIRFQASWESPTWWSAKRTMHQSTVHHFTPSPYAGRTCNWFVKRGWVPLLGSTHFTPQFLGAQIAEMEFPSGHRNGR